MSKLILLASFFILTPFVIISSIIYLSFLQFQKNQNTYGYFSKQHIAYAALPTNQGELSAELGQEDARVEKVTQFLTKYDSPLEPYSQNIVSAADQYGLDFRLVPAIAMQESNLCKKIPKGSYNCWGFGVYGKKVTKFDGYKDAIETVSKTLATDYKNYGLETPDEIMEKYAPSNNGSWASSVRHFMSALSINP